MYKQRLEQARVDRAWAFEHNQGPMVEHETTERAHSIAVGMNLAVDAVTAEATTAFREAGVRSLLLKGPPSVRWLYGSDAGRFSTDVDLLVEPASLDAAEKILTDLSFRPLPQNIGPSEPRHARGWERDASPVEVDLHVSIVGARVSGEDVWRVLSRRTDHVFVHGACVEIPSAPARALLVALHAAQHGAAWEQALRDLERAVARLPACVWEDAASLAAELGATSSLAVGLEIVDGGSELVDRLALPIERTVEATLRAWTAPHLTLGIDRLATAPGLRAKGDFLIRKVFPPPDWMRRWSPLGGRGHIGLAAAYAWRPIWLLVRTPRALAAWSRARKASRPAT
jgi:Uncharacterised nucleotidyltransferase